MATATPDVVEEMFAVILDEDAPPCMNETCSVAARWATRCPSCSFDYHFCDGHRTKVDRQSRLGPVTCDAIIGCGAWFPVSLIWRPI